MSTTNPPATFQPVDALDPEEIDRVCGANVRERRRRLGISQQELGHKVGLTFQQIQKYERGSNRISISKLCQIANALRCHPASLIPAVSNALPGAAVESFQSRAVSLYSESPDLFDAMATLSVPMRRMLTKIIREFLGAAGETGHSVGLDAEALDRAHGVDGVELSEAA